MTIRIREEGPEDAEGIARVHLEAFERRFGLHAAGRFGLRCRWGVPPGVFQALELVPGAVGHGVAIRLVLYHRAFDALD